MELSNSTPLIEAADTGPFFHNNARNTIEEAVDFSNGPEFNNSRAIGAQINLSDQEVDDIANFLRITNSLENIRSSVDFLTRAFDLVGVDQDGFNKALTASIFDLNDAKEVLDEKGLHPAAQGHLNAALAQVNNALKAKKDSIRKNKITQAVKKAVQAQDDMCVSGDVLCEATEL